MNKPALKRFATEARRELLERVELQARKIGITSEGIQKATIESSDSVFIDGKQLKEQEIVKRNKLISRIRDIGFERVVEEVAYTWFNRFTALRFMEVNDYLPTRIRILSSVIPESTEPDMMKEALTLDLDLDKEYIYELKLNNKDDELFKYLIIKHCNDLNRYMPFMFETIDDYTETLFPEGLLASDSFIKKMTNIESIPESNWKNIEVIGWLYQYYIAEEKDRVFKAKKKYKAEEIPFATQLFTPDWIVRYMVQNSLGRYWVEANPKHKDLINYWEFYLQNSEDDFEEKIAPYINKNLKVEDIKCFDPAMGSGHILVYMFEVLYEIYSKSGYMEREIPRLIIENNLYGLDIDDRAYQLASFSVVMKAMAYNKRFLNSIKSEGLTLNLASIQETNTLTEEDIKYLIGGNKEKLVETRTFIQQFQDAKSIGSLIKVKESDTSYLQQRLDAIQTTPVTNLFEVEHREKILSLLPFLMKQAKIMSLDFDVLVTNPPYMGGGAMNKELTNYLKENYVDSKSDLFASFMELEHYLKRNSVYAFINQHSWMFLSSFEKLRHKIVGNKFIDSMLHLGPRAFDEIGGEVVQSTAFVLRNYVLEEKGIYIRLVEERSAINKKRKAVEIINSKNVSQYYFSDQSNFDKIPGTPIAYWISDKMSEIFIQKSPLNNYADSCIGMRTGDNKRFLRFWHEVDNTKIGFSLESAIDAIKLNKKWIPYNKGGSFRKWYGNNEYIVNWENNGKEIKDNTKLVYPQLGDNLSWKISNEHQYFKKGITWSGVTMNTFGVRCYDKGSIFDSGANGLFVFDNSNYYYLAGLLNSKLVDIMIKIINPTINTGSGVIAKIPTSISLEFKKEVEDLVIECINIAKNDWDLSETSWDYARNPLVSLNNISGEIEKVYSYFKQITNENFDKLKSNEEKLNTLFLNIYELQDEISPQVEEKHITINKADIKREIKSLISYSVGCFLGRYSLDKEGLIFAGGELDTNLYKTIKFDEDNILPLVSGAYFEDDIVNKFIDFIKVVFGNEDLELNLNFIANNIERRKNETARETLRRYFIDEFAKDHLQLYKKKPIYWLFTSGKERAFNCLIYMHRYDKTTLSRIRTDYLHEVQIRLDSEKKDLLNIIDEDSSTKEISDAKKELKSLDKKIDELKAYDEKLHHMADMQIEINLDDGVAVNYAKFEGLVAKI
ncbi:BREX-1 system adenine-specific DNA-methyltransferase PglX [Planomicrobium okeanokoites]|uniref:BREX-1 system adenine-specific DNA-methyltransferase PglX n=1 Tax=Planomicrobium okeanokoites TaxID=244 RepID=UPI002490A0B7|nr:BREX-1 system adenine-specific DNA-methyltransferase PglX [Planomicrobium okeanokoites]